MLFDERQNRVFLSYASEDIDEVRQVYHGLIKRGLDVWFDKEKLGPGKRKSQIKRAIYKSRYFVVCLSNAAVREPGDEPGFQDEELNEAYEIARVQSETEFTILPVRLEDCNRGDHCFALFHQYDLFDDFERGLDKVAVNMGGISLSDPGVKDERTDDEKLIDSLFTKAVAEYYAGRVKDSITLIDAILAFPPDQVETWYAKRLALQNDD